jgi:hypothetical protein
MCLSGIYIVGISLFAGSWVRDVSVHLGGWQFKHDIYEKSIDKLLYNFTATNVTFYISPTL